MAVAPSASQRPLAATTTFTVDNIRDPDGDVLTTTIVLRELSTNRIRDIPCPGGRCTLALRDATEYSWSVRVSDGLNDAEGFGPTFKTNSPPLPPPIDPEDNDAEQVPFRALTFFWNPTVDPDGDAITYSLYYEGRDGVERPACIALVSTRCNFPVELTAGTQYALRLAATDANGLMSNSYLNFTTRLPLVLLHGYTTWGYADGDATWSRMRSELEALGYEVLDFYPTDSRHALSYDDTVDGGIAVIAETVQSRIRRALVASGYDEDQRIDIIAHSMGGLVARFMIEKPGAREVWGERVVIDDGWDGQVRRLVTLGTPHRGTGYANFCVYDVCDQMERDSTFLRFLGYSPTPTVTSYKTLVGVDDAIVDRARARLDSAPYYEIAGACHSDEPCGLTFPEVSLAFVLDFLG